MSTTPSAGGDKNLDALLARAETWRQEHRTFIALIYTEMWKTGRWPSINTLQQELDRNPYVDLGLAEIALHMPPDMGIYEHRLSSTIMLSVQALYRQSFVDQQLLQDFVDLVQVIVKHYLHHKSYDTLQSTELDDLFKDRPDRRQRVIQLLEVEKRNLFMNPEHMVGESEPLTSPFWTRWLKAESVREFRRVRTVEDYILVDTRLRASGSASDETARRKPTQRSRAGDVTTIHYNINAPIGQLNAGDRQRVANLQSRIVAVESRGVPQVAEALQQVSQAAINDSELGEAELREVLETIEDLAEASELPPEERKGGRIKGAIAVITAAAGAATQLGQAWQQWGPVISGHLGGR